MIPEPLAIGHLLMLAGFLAALWGVWQLGVFLRHRGHGRGTPGYARARDARRFALWGLAAGALLYAAGCLTPLRDTPIA